MKLQITVTEEVDEARSEYVLMASISHDDGRGSMGEESIRSQNLYGSSEESRRTMVQNFFCYMSERAGKTMRPDEFPPVIQKQASDGSMMEVVP